MAALIISLVGTIVLEAIDVIVTGRLSRVIHGDFWPDWKLDNGVLLGPKGKA